MTWNLIRMVLFVVLFYVPGRAIVIRRGRTPGGLDTHVLALLTGFLAVSGLAFVEALTALVFVTPWVLAGNALFILAVRFRTVRRYVARWSDRTVLEDGFERSLVLLAVGAFVLFFIRYEPSHFYYGCLNSSVAWATGQPIGNMPNAPIQRILFFHQDAQIGGTALVAPFHAFLGPVGERVLTATVPAMLALVTGLTARVWFGRVASLGAAAAFSLSPYLFRIPAISINALAWLAGISTVYLMVRGRRAFWAGVATGMYVGVLYVNVLVVPVFLVWAWSARGRSFPFGGFLRGLALVGLALLVQNTVAHGSPLSYGSFRTVAETGHAGFAYSLLGIDFRAHALFNWPLHDHIVRTPLNPYPTFLLLPLYFVRFFGLLLTALLPVGVYALAGSKRRLLLLLLAWASVIAALLGIQENWLQVEKMATPFDIFPPLSLFMAAGIHHLGDAPRFRGLCTYVVSLLLVAGAYLFGTGVNAPTDGRFYNLFPAFPREEAGYLAWEKAPYSRLRFFPDFSECGRPFRKGVGARLARYLAVKEHGDRRESAREAMLRASIPGIYFAFMMPSMPADRMAGFIDPEDGRPRRGGHAFLFRFRRHPLGGEALIEQAPPAGDAIDLARDLPCRIPLGKTPWSEQPIESVWFAKDGEVYIVLVRPLDPRLERFERLFAGAYREGIPGATALPWQEPPIAYPVRAQDSTDGGIRFRAAWEQTVHLVDSVYLDPSRIYWRTVDLSDGGIRMSAPIYWHAN